MDPLRLLVWMTYWVRRPPSRAWLTMAAIVAVTVTVIYLVEQYVGWPEWLTVEPRRHRVIY